MSSKPMTREDCLIDIGAHIANVRRLMNKAIIDLSDRSIHHDASKLDDPELDIFCKHTPVLKELEYNSPEYKDCLQRMSPAIKHHYSKNRHHPEHFPKGWRDMNLIDLLEMICDWRAAADRHENGNVYESLVQNEARFKLPKYLTQILRNTVEYLEQDSDGEEIGMADS